MNNNIRFELSFKNIKNGLDSFKQLKVMNQTSFFINEVFKSFQKIMKLGVRYNFYSVIIKYSVEWWSTLHQPASIKITGTSTIHSSMLTPLMLMFLVLILYCALIFLMEYKTEIIRIKKKNLKRYD